MGILWMMSMLAVAWLSVLFTMREGNIETVRTVLLLKVIGLWLLFGGPLFLLAANGWLPR